MMLISRTRHTGSSSICESNVVLDAGLDRPDPLEEAGEAERGEFA